MLCLAAVLALVVWGYDPIYAFSRGWALLLPFLIGCITGPARHASAARSLPPVVAAAVLGTSVWLYVGLGTNATAPTTGGPGRTEVTIAWGVLGSVAGTVAALAVAALGARSPLGPLVAVVGRRSLEIFLAHIVVASGTRIILVQAGVTDPWVHVLAATTLGVFVPIAVAVAAERLGWTWLFGLPEQLRPESKRRPRLALRIEVRKTAPSAPSVSRR